ncbi:hypothetical protein ACWEO1_16840 [Kitasatospora cineracea]
MSFWTDGTFWTAFGALSAAGLAFWSTRKASAAAKDAAATAKEVAKIERDRWHRELTPELKFTLTRHGLGNLQLSVALDGPAGLDRLDNVTLTLLDDRAHLASPALNDEERAEFPNVIWGPVRFTPVTDGVAEPGREAVIGSLEIGGHAVQRQMEDSVAPSWYRDRLHHWKAEYHKQAPTVRIRAVCTHKDFQPWTLVANVRTEVQVDSITD